MAMAAKLLPATPTPDPARRLRSAAWCQLRRVVQLPLPLPPVVPEPGPWKPPQPGQRQRKRPVRGQLRMVYDRTAEHRNKRARAVGPLVIREGKRVRLHVADPPRAAIAVGRRTWCEDYESALRPRHRWQCDDVPRPCPYVSCAMHLYLDIEPDGALRLNFPDLEPDEMQHSCARDVAEAQAGAKGTMGPAELARHLNLSREEARKVLVAAVQRYAAAWEAQTGERPALLDMGEDERDSAEEDEMGEIGDVEWGA